MPIPSRSVIVCAYTLDRLELTSRCLEAVLAQQPAPDQVIAVIDHNDALAHALRLRFPSGVEIVPNAGPPGLSAARNTGIGVARGEIVAFVDDDAVPETGWLAGLTDAFADESTVGVGGGAVPTWETAQPGWFPDEYLWVVGCSYQGQPRRGVVRNPLGCNMAFRRSVFEAVGGFDLSVGRLGTLPVGCEETELCLRAVRAISNSQVVLVEGAEVRHFVPRERGTWRYFVRRCFYEGVSKSVIRRLSEGRALGTERGYVTRTLTAGVGRRAVRALRIRGAADELAGIAAIGIGLGAATAGYVVGWFRTRAGVPRRPGTVDAGGTVTS
jgi:GT2 family glycosyltransferase